MFFACAKDKTTNSSGIIAPSTVATIAPESFLTYIKSKITQDPDAMVSVYSTTMSRFLPTPQVQITASINSQLGDGKSIKQISLGDIDLPRLFDSVNTKTFFQATFNDKRIFGQKDKFNFLTDFFDLKSEFQLPELVKIQVANQSYPEEISKSKGFHLYWNKDENNGLPVQITLEYNEFTSRAMNPDLPKKEIRFSKFVSDSGEYILNPADLFDFPSGGQAIISVTRGSFSVLNNNNKNILIYSLLKDTHPSYSFVD